MFSPRADHANRLRIAALVLFSVCFIFTLAFVTSASLTVHGHYAMTKLTLSVMELTVFTVSLSLTNAIVCGNDPFTGDEQCTTVSIDDLKSGGFYDQHNIPTTCPQSAGSWVIAAQSLILFFMLIPMYSVTKSLFIQIPRQRLVAGVTLLLSFIFAATSIGVWYSQCVVSFNQSWSLTQMGVSADPSGAYAFEAINFVILIGATVCNIAYWVLTRNEDFSYPKNDAFVQNPAADSSSQYYNAGY